ncbi:hypothetical protein SAMN04489712_11846 [Thermomonospora echinospora]|uniref:Uncharacterized protein n=2 Tax=Thermomonospora echinospora TaxID=1992 RepID=A0A1H6DLN2_9ACTN|nr:hypothetical protein SAMN04489712_11846 [Thermomonospora echinospora]
MPITLVRPRRVTALFRARVRGRRPAPPPWRPCGPQSADEVALAIALTARWMLVTGRRIDQVPLLHDLPGDQLIDFWSDDHVAGPHPPRPAADRREVRR